MALHEISDLNDFHFPASTTNHQVDGIAVVSSFVLTPYTSFWQPQQPTYNPVEACFHLTHPQIHGGRIPYYESPRFRVNGSMKVQTFVPHSPDNMNVDTVNSREKQRQACRNRIQVTMRGRVRPTALLPC